MWGVTREIGFSAVDRLLVRYGNSCWVLDLELPVARAHPSDLGPNVGDAAIEFGVLEHR